MTQSQINKEINKLFDTLSQTETRIEEIQAICTHPNIEMNILGPNMICSDCYKVVEEKE